MLAVIIQLQEQPGAANDGASASAGGDPTTRDSKLFAKLDADGDGTISKSEFETALASRGGDAATADSLFSSTEVLGLRTH